MAEPTALTPRPFRGGLGPADDDLASCVHCGLCLNDCPTFRITGLETESPRGRIYLMTQWSRGDLLFDAKQARHIDLCLGCRACEAVCPSGVPYGRIIEQARAEIERHRRRDPTRQIARFALRNLVAHPDRLRSAGMAVRLAQRFRLTQLSAQGRRLPKLERPFTPPAGAIVPAIGERRLRVAFLTGCVMPIMYPKAHAASVSLLQLAGCEIWFPPGQACCGALHAHSGDSKTAESLRQVNSVAFAAADFDYLVVNSAGCGAHIKDSYLPISTKVRDLSELLIEVGIPKPSHRLAQRVTYQDACHLAHAQRIKTQPRQLMAMMAGLELVEMHHPDVCCGAAGLYSAVEPDMSARILDEKLDDLIATGAQAVVCANPGCQMQLEAGLRSRRSTMQVLHIAELLLLGYPEHQA